MAKNVVLKAQVRLKTSQRKSKVPETMKIKEVVAHHMEPKKNPKEGQRQSAGKKEKDSGIASKRM